MSRATIIIGSPETRHKASEWVQKAPPGTRVEFKRSKRTLPQNDRFWAMLTDIADQLLWHGQKLSPVDWKLIFLDALRREMNEQMRMVPNTDGTGFVPLGNSSSALTISEMGDLMEIMTEFGARHGVKFNDQEQAA